MEERALATGPICATLGFLKKVANEIRESGTFGLLTGEAISYEELNLLAARKH